MSDTRFSCNRTKFAAKMRVIDNLQLSDDSAPGTKKWEDFKWLIANM
jgi:hypothetical protein